MSSPEPRPGVIREKVWPYAWLGLAAVIVGGSIGLSVPADAAPSGGCERISWGLHLLTPQKRTICDGPRRADGSWDRFRQLWTPSYYVPWSCSYGTYSGYRCGGDYSVADQVWEETTYVVFDHNVLPDEPGWLPAGSLVIR